MKWLAGLIAALFLITACAPTSNPPATASSSQNPQWLLASAERAPIAGLVLVTVKMDQPERLQELGRALQEAHGLTLEAEWPLQTIGIHCLVFRVPGDGNMDAALVKLRADDRVRTAEPMRAYHTLALRHEADLTALQSPMEKLSVWEAHKIATGRGVVIGLVDTGVEASHPDLAGQLALWKDFTGAPPGEIGERHGTAMAGILAAKAGDKAGITGVAPSAKLMALRGCWETAGQGHCTTFTLARAINFAIAKKVDVLNLSLTGPEDSVLKDLLLEAARRGITLVAADNGDSFPASMPEVIGVDRTTRRSAIVAAPAEDILSTAPEAKYDFFTGSSVASAHIAGIAALLREVRPGSAGGDIANALQQASPGKKGRKRRGAPNACLAIQAICTSPDAQNAPACVAARRCGQG